jgi:hypothetical protein
LQDHLVGSGTDRMERDLVSDTIILFGFRFNDLSTLIAISLNVTFPGGAGAAV